MALCAVGSGCIWQDHAGRQAGGPHYEARGTWIPSPGTMAHLGSSPGLKLQGQGLTVLTEHLHLPGWSFHSLRWPLSQSQWDLGCLDFQPSLSLQRITMVASSWLSRSPANSPSVLLPVLKTLPLTQQFHCQQFTRWARRQKQTWCYEHRCLLPHFLTRTQKQPVWPSAATTAAQEDRCGLSVLVWLDTEDTKYTQLCA